MTKKDLIQRISQINIKLESVVHAASELEDDINDIIRDMEYLPSEATEIEDDSDSNS